MVKILFAPSNAYQENGIYKLTGLYDQMVSSLVEEGNEVLVFIPNIFNRDVFGGENKLKDNINEEKLRQDIINFKPELVISFNNANYEKILEITDCPIVIWGADLESYWNQLDYVKKNIDRYCFFCFSKAEMSRRKEVFKIKDDRIFNIRSATNLKNTNIDKRINISFIGTFFGMDADIAEMVWNNSGNLYIKQFLELIHNNPFLKTEEIIENIDERSSSFIEKIKKIDCSKYINCFSREDRLKTLSNISDLGLDLYGDNGWEQIKYIFPSLIACFKHEIIYSAKQNEDIYNSSKICININHAQSSQGMPFRVLDIMATGGCLVSSYSPFIDNIFKKYIEIPMYKDSFEARSLCKKLINDDILRNEVVKISNDVVEKEHRWKHRFKEIENIFNLNFFNNKVGKLYILKPVFNEKIYKFLNNKSYTKEKLSFKNQIRYYLWKKLDKKLREKGILK